MIMTSKFKLITAIMILFTSISSAQDKINSLLYDPNIQAVEMQVDVIHIKLELDIEPYTQIIKGKQDMKIRTLRQGFDSLTLYAPEMKFDKVLIDGVECSSEIRGNDIIIYNKKKLNHNQQYDLYIEFTGNPTSGLYFSGWNDQSGTHRRQIFAHSPQGWMPFINQKHDLLTTEIITTFDSDYKIFSNGIRVSEKDNGNGTKTWHYHMDRPHVIYLVCFGAGKWDYKVTQSASGVPMELWYYPDLKENFEPSYLYSEYMIDFFEKEIGVRYPYAVYRQAPMVNYMYGAMETTTATVFGDYMYIPPRAWWMRNYVNVNSHELNHQWFGNLVSHLNNRHTWLTESFATHYAKIFERDVFGEDYYQWERDKELLRTFDAAESNNNPVAHSMAGTARWYPKGSLVLDMMRDVMSDSLFRLAIKHYTLSNQYKVVESYDLLKSIRESTGMSLDWFFDQWIFRGGEPHLKIGYSDLTDNQDNRFTQVTVEQIHPVDNLIKYFSMPVNVHVYYEDNSIDSVSSWFKDKLSIINIPNNSGKNIDFVVFDPNRKIIKKTEFSRTFDELSSQAEIAHNMIDRYDALIELRKFDIESKRTLLQRIFKNETFHLTKSEIVKQLASDDKSIEFLREIIKDDDVLVKRSLLENLKIVPESLEKDYKRLLKDTCFVNAELALRNLSSSFPDKNYLTGMEKEIGWRGMNIRMAWLEIALSKQSDNKKYLDELSDYTSNRYEFETRMNAFDVLLRLNLINEKVISNSIDAFLHWNYKLSGAAFSYLNYYFKQNKSKKLILQQIEKYKPDFANHKAKLKNLQNRLQN